MRVPRELVLIAVLFFTIAAAALLLRPESTADKPPALSSHSAAPDGALGLYLWLHALGYHVDRIEYRRFAPSQATGVLVILAPTEAADKEELAALRGWVEKGGILILAGASSRDPNESVLSLFRDRRRALGVILATFGLSLSYAPVPVAEVEPAQPLLYRPAVGRVRVESDSYVNGPAGLVPYLGPTGKPVAAGIAEGKGRVYVLASDEALTNRSIALADNAALLLNWLPSPALARGIAFDEVHHGLVATRSLTRAALSHPWGWAVFYAFAAVFLFLLLGGRRFGRAVAEVVDGRRPASEYVVSLAGLLRRAGKADWVARHYAQSLRRQLTVTFALDPALDPSAVAERLSGAGSSGRGLDGDAVGRLLSGLENPRSLGERELVRLAAECDKAINACKGRR